MTSLPAELLATLPTGTEGVATAWWYQLAEEEQQRIAKLWDDRYEVQFFTPQHDELGTMDSWEKVPHVKGGRFMPSDEDGRDEWQPGYFEHLLQHPELVLAYEPQLRVFHIGCTQHPQAQRCLQQGYVPSNFTCPFEDKQCPMLPLRGATLRRPAGNM